MFNSQKDFEGHLAANYAEMDADASHSALIKTCGRPILPSASAHCPFCLESVLSRKKIRNHIGQHLADISLRALPTTVADTEFLEDEVSNNSTDSEHTTVDNEVSDSVTLNSVRKDFVSRVEDWKNDEVERFGSLLIHGEYDVVGTGRLSKKVRNYPMSYPSFIFLVYLR